MKRILSVVAVATITPCMAAEPPSPLQEWREPTTGMVFVALPKGCFHMGTETPLAARDEHLWPHLGMTTAVSADEHPRHEVCVDAVWMGKHEVRASDWARVMGAPPPSGRGNMPAAGMDWSAAQAFAARLGELTTGRRFRFRLPTEAEWEYACRAGSADDVLAEDDELSAVAWVSRRDHRKLEPSEVGKLQANAWGLHDMLGNVWEWTADAYAANAYAGHVLFNPVVRTAPGDERVIRGASHRSHVQEARCANRGAYPAALGLVQIGLRLVREP